MLQDGASARAATLGAAKAGVAAYGLSYVTDLAKHGSGYIIDREAKVQEIYNENRRQATQGYAQNFGENFVNPGRATFQLAQE